MITRPALRYFGGKFLLADWINSNLPQHRVYVEPFGGAASVLLSKARAHAEIYNDMDGEIARFFQVLRNPVLAVELERQLKLTPFSRDELVIAQESTNDPVEEARRLVIRAFQGFGPPTRKSGFRASSNRSGTTPAHDWVNYPEQIKFFTERLSAVVIENKEATDVMAAHDSKETLHYVDPPYISDTRVSKKEYRFEMTDEQHLYLINFLKDLKGMVILSGYDHELYDSLGWKSLKKQTTTNTAKIRVETLWFNERAWANKPQPELYDPSN